jgi:hypothetical protein
MTTEVEQVQEKETSAEDARAAEAAFDASFKDEPAPAAEKPKEVQAEPAKADEAKPEVEEVKESEAAPAKAETPSPTPAPVDYGAELRKLHGRIGALNDQLQTALKAKETEGKPAVLSPVELKRFKDEYPEMAGTLQEDIAEAIAGIKQAAPDPKVIEALVTDRVERQMSELRDAAVTDVHETWKTDLFAEGKRTAEYDAWLKTMPTDEAEKLESSNNPHYVIKKLNQFYDWKGKEAKAKTEKQDRLKAALTPQGVPRAGQSTLSDEEAMRKGFDDAFASTP